MTTTGTGVSAPIFSCSSCTSGNAAVSSSKGIGDRSGLTTPTLPLPRSLFRSLRAGDGGEVERGDDDGAYCELVQDMGGDALPEESECDANGELERSRACACCNTSV